MTLALFSLVLAAAAMHATWNALIKTRSDRFASISLATLGASIVVLPILPFVDFPSIEVWIWIAASVIIHAGYRLFLVKTYDVGDFAQSYPLARGIAPLITTVGAIIFIGEVPEGLTVLGIVVLSFGALLMSLRGSSDLSKFNRRAVGFALLTSMLIAGYTLTDGYGVRLANTASSYAAWLFFCDGLCSIAIGFLYRGRGLLTVLASEWKTNLLTGGLLAGSYWIIMWAMTKAPIASIAALRETSILFAMLISVLVLGERVTPCRVLATVFIVGGVVILRLG
jgi:drug/metabolite transporter (DMT)-like permease